MSNNKTLVVVLTRNYSTGLSVVRSLGAAGYPVDIVASGNKEGKSAIVASSKYVTEHCEVITKKVKDANDDELVARLLEYKGKYDEKPVLFPTDDYTASVMDYNRSKLKDIFIMPSIKDGEDGRLAYLMNKIVQCNIAAEVGFPVAKGWEISLREDVIEIPEDMVYPCFVKPAESITGYKLEMKRCDTKEDLESHLYLLQSNFRNRTILVQEFLNIDREIELDGLCFDQEIIVPAVSYNTIVAEHEKGVPIAGALVPFEDLGETKQKVIDVLRAYHYTGMFDMGILQCGDTIYFNEINLRSGGPNYVYFASGVNLPELFIKEVTGQTRTEEEQTVDCYGKSFIYEEVAWNEIFAGLMTEADYFRERDNADVRFMYNEEDPVPYEMFSESINRERTFRTLKATAIENVSALTGLDNDTAWAKVNATREATGMTLRDYVNNEFWNIPEENQVTEYNNLLERRERNRQAKEECLAAITEAGFAADAAETMLSAAREKTGISYRDYLRNEFWLVPEENWEKTYEDIQNRKEKNRQRKEECISATMEGAGWDRETAEEKIRDARERLSISYKDYTRNEFWNIPVEDQAAKYKEILENRKKKNAERDKLNANLVVVLSRNYSTGLAVIRSLGSAGYTVDLVASALREGASVIASSSKYVRKSAEVVSKKVKDGGDTELVEELLKYASSSSVKPVLFPTDDYTASVMDLNRDKLEDIFIMPEIIGGGQGSMTEHMDKTVQGRLAKEAGLLTPLEWIISLEHSIDIPEDMVYPCFCKPIESVTGYKTEMAKCNSEGELRAHLAKLQKKFANRSVLVQEFLEIDNEIDFSGVCFDQKVIIPAIIKKTNVAQYEKGVTLAGKVVPFEEMGDLQDKIIKMLQLFHYNGMFDMELNIVGDKIYFNEVNLRSGGPNFSYFMSGVNLPALFVKEMRGQQHTPEEEKVSEYGKSFIYEKVAWDDHINGFMTKAELNKCIADADITLLCNNDDPEPGKIFTAKIKKSARKRKIKHFMNKLRPIIATIKAILWGYPQTKAKNHRNPDLKPRVLVAGRNYCSNLTMARSLGKAGYEVEVLKIFQVKPSRKNLLKKVRPDAYSKYIKAYHVCVARRKSHRIVDAIMALRDPGRKMLLIPADDLVAFIADEYFDELREYFYIPNVEEKAGEINRLMSKSVQKQLALEAGLPVVNSCVIATHEGQFEIPDTVTYPCFMKPNISKNSSKGKMRKCNSEEELRGYLTEFSEKKDIEMLVEDFVDIHREFSLLGVSTKDGVIGPGFFGAVEGGKEEHRGVAVTGEILPVKDYQPLIDNLIKFIESLKFDGLYDVDLIQTADGKLYFIELNMRFGASGYAYTECGCNLPGMFADYMTEGKPLDMNASISDSDAGKIFVSEKVLIEEYAKGRLEKAEMHKLFNEADIHFVFNPEDGKAYRHFKKFYPIASIMRKLYAIKERRESDAEADN